MDGGVAKGHKEALGVISLIMVIVSQMYNIYQNSSYCTPKAHAAYYMSVIAQESCVKHFYLGDSNLQLNLRTPKHIHNYPMSFSFGLEVGCH